MDQRQKNALVRRQKFLCGLTCWAVAGFVALVMVIALLRSDAWSAIQALFVSGLAFFAVGAALALLFCRPLPGPVPAGSAGRGTAQQADPTPGAAAQAAPAPAPAAPADRGLEDLQRIRGVGPKLAQTLVDRGVTGLATVAAWTEDDVTWWDENLEGFRGRVSRDGWVDQARELLAQDAAEEGAAHGG